MTGHSARVTVLAAALISIATLAQAQRQTPEQILQIVGDGAAECASAKVAASAHAPRHTFSVASANFDATYYHLDLFVGMVDDSISGQVRVQGRVVNSALSQLTLDLGASMVVTSVTFVGGGALSYTHPGAALNITLPSAQAPGTVFAVDIRYHGVPTTDGFGNFVFGTRGVIPNEQRYAWSLSEPYGAREWWPCKDHPSDKADSVRVTVEVPSLYRVGSQGVLVSELPAGPNTIYDWVSHYPIASYLVSVAIGVYAQHNDTYVRPAALEAELGPLSLPLVHLRYNDGTPELPTGWAATADIMEVQEDWFGPYPFANEKYGHSEFNFSGGMEHQTMTSIGSSAVSVVAHELAHQWYGDSVTPQRWKHLWLNEGFATWAEMLYFRERPDDYHGTYDVFYSSRYQSAKNATGTLVLEDTTSVNDMFNGSRVYAKGAIVLSMLEFVVGEATFKEILKAYAADPAVIYGNAVTADFQRVAETVSGRDLDTFFSQWVTQGTGYPRYTADIAWEPIASGYHVDVTLEQTQSMPHSNVSVFEMPVEMTVLARNPADSIIAVVVQVDNNRRLQDFAFDVAIPPSFAVYEVVIDPHRHILRADVADAPPAMPYPTISSVRPNPTRGALQVEYRLDTDSPVDVHVFDVAGRRVLTQTLPGSSGTGVADIDTSRLASGVYFLRLSNAKGEAKTKFVVVR